MDKVNIMDTVADLLNSGRFGTFKLYRNFLEKLQPNVLQQALAGMIITRCEYRFDQDCFEYIAFYPHFDKVEAGCEPNDYFLKVITEQTNHSDYTYFKWIER